MYSMEKQGCVYVDVKCEWPTGCETCGWNPAEAERRKEIISSECHPSKDKPYRLILKGEKNQCHLTEK